MINNLQPDFYLFNNRSILVETDTSKRKLNLCSLRQKLKLPPLN